jgi:hypothetical protein
LTNQITNRKWVCVLAVTTLLAASTISVAVFSAKRQQPSKQKQQKRVMELPPIVSHVPRLAIASITVRDAGTTDPRAVIEIRNNSDLAVMAVEISTKNGGDSGAVNADGLDDPDNPKVVIPPHGTTTLEMSFSEMIVDAPLVLSAAVFADGSEDGDKWSFDAMRAVREHHQSLRKAQKGGGKQ